MDFNKDGNKITLYYIGEPDAIDEVIAFGYSDKEGLGIARVLGDEMNINAIMNMVENAKVDLKHFDFGQINSFFE